MTNSKTYLSVFSSTLRMFANILCKSLSFSPRPPALCNPLTIPCTLSSGRFPCHCRATTVHHSESTPVYPHIQHMPDMNSTGDYEALRDDSISTPALVLHKHKCMQNNTVTFHHTGKQFQEMFIVTVTIKYYTLFQSTSCYVIPLAGNMMS